MKQFFKQFIKLHQTIKSKPTKYFLFLIVVFFGLFLQAYMHNYNIVYIVLFFLFALSGSSCLIGRLNLVGLELVPFMREGYFANSASSVSFKLTNSAKRDTYALFIASSYIANIASNSEQVIKIENRFSKRGYNDFDAVEVVSFFPFGHIRFSKKITIQKQFLIYPELAGIDLHKAFAKELANFGVLDSFERLQHYTQGESLSKIHWASVAKGELLSKKFSFENEDNRLHFYLTQAGKETEERLSQLALWVVQATTLGFDFVVHLPQKSLDSKEEGKDEILQELALYK